MTTSVEAPGKHFTRRMFECAIEVVRSSDDPIDRSQAAHVACLLTYDGITTDERLLAEVLATIGIRLADSKVVDLLLSALRRLTQGHAGLAPGLERLASRANNEKLDDSLRTLVVHMLPFPEWARRVRKEWASAVLRFDSPQSCRVSQAVILRWLEDHGSVTEWMREAVELHPEILATYFPDSMRWRLHQAAPTVHGWQLLAAPGDQREQMLKPEAFGDQLDVAVESLEAALAAEPGEARRVILAKWLSEVAG